MILAFGFKGILLFSVGISNDLSGKDASILRGVNVTQLTAMVKGKTKKEGGITPATLHFRIHYRKICYETLFNFFDGK